jgi:hypothetical protein
MAAAEATTRIPGCRAKLIDSVLKASNLVGDALVKLESILEAQHGVDPMSIIHGPQHWKPQEDPAPESHAPPPQRNGRRDDGATMAPWAWWLEGRRFRTLSDDFIQLGWDLCGGIGNKRADPAFSRIALAFDHFHTARCILDDLVCEQHPRWLGSYDLIFGTGSDQRLSFTPHGTIDYSQCTEHELGMFRLKDPIPSQYEAPSF